MLQIELGALTLCTLLCLYEVGFNTFEDQFSLHRLL